MYYSIIADAYYRKGDVEGGLAWVAKALPAIKQTDEVVYLPPLLITKGDLKLLEKQQLSDKDSSNPLVVSKIEKEAEQSYLKAINIAKKHGNKWFELRGCIRLSKLWQSQACLLEPKNRQIKNTEAYNLLHEKYSWFTEGFDTIDILEAKTLLEELTQLI